MGAAAFIMAETLGIPYNDLILVALVPAALHYFAILFMVHLESKRLKLMGMPASEIPSIGKVLVKFLASVHPAGGDGDLAVDAVHALPGGFLGHYAHGGLLLDSAPAWSPGPEYERYGTWGHAPWCRASRWGPSRHMGIGAACACVGFVLGITTLTGMGFKFSAWVLDVSGVAAQCGHGAGRVSVV